MHSHSQPLAVVDVHTTFTARYLVFLAQIPVQSSSHCVMCLLMC